MKFCNGVNLILINIISLQPMLNTMIKSNFISGSTNKKLVHDTKYESH